ncbi:hypothetical protein PG989_013985 [Apiospora arundinis]
MDLLRRRQSPWPNFGLASPRRGYSTSESDNESETGLLGGMSKPRTNMKHLLCNPWFFLSHLAALAGYVFIFFAFNDFHAPHRPLSKAYTSSLPHSPGVEALTWEPKNFRAEDKIQETGKYAGKPSPELDRRWHDLLNAENIIVEEKYMHQLGREHLGVRTPEGTGFIGTLNVYHEIHCLKRIHQYMYPDYYFPEFTAQQHEVNRLHNEHCIDFILQSTMCHGDVGLMTFEWVEDNLIPLANSTSHQCVNWEKLDTWTRARSVDMMKPNWLIHPVLGPAYPDGKGDKLGAAVSKEQLGLSGGYHMQ